MGIKKTKIIATIGPATNNYKALKEIILNGANVIRINCSHGNIEDEKNNINLVQKIRKELNIPISIMLDTRGPEIRIGKFKNNSVELKKNQIFSFYKQTEVGDENGVSIQQPEIFENIIVGNKILACNGLITFKVCEKNANFIKCKVLNDGVISNNKSLFLPNVEYNIPYLNEQDKANILIGIKNNVEYISASFVNKKEDIDALRNFIQANGGRCDIIAKIESKLGIKNLDEIIENADGVMVARGDLGVEIPSEKLPELQKMIIKKAQSAGKIVITATEMLESMISSPRPTRAETSDVANAIYDGTSAIMLSGETAVGKYPNLAVQAMNKIAQETEKSIHYKKRYFSNNFSSNNITDVLSNSVVHVSFMLNELKAIAVYTDSGHTAKMISRFRPNCPVVALTPNEETFNKLSLVWGVVPILCKPCKTPLNLIKSINKHLVIKKLAKPNDMILIGTGTRNPSDTDMIKIHVVK